MKPQVFCVLVCLSAASGASPSWKKCPPTDPNVEECLKEAVQGALKDLVHGSQIGFIDLEPVKHDRVAIIDTPTGPFRGKLIYNDLSVDGFSSAEVEKVEKRPGGILRIQFHFPKTKISGKYFMDTVLLAVPMKGNGDFTLMNEKLSITFDFTIKKKPIGGVIVYNADSVDQADFKVEFLQINHSNLFNGNKALGDNVNKILNEQWRTLAKELGPITVKAFSPIYVKIANQVLNKIPAGEFPLPLA